MAGTVLIDNTGYTIIGGTTRIEGTGYLITSGTTRINGTAYDISFNTKKYTLEDLLKRINIIDIVGRNASSAGRVQITIPSTGTYYLFAFYSGRISIYKLNANGASSTVTALKRVSSTYASILVDNPNLILQPTSSSTTCMGGTIAIIRFNDYTEAEADTILSGCSVTVGAGRNNKGTGSLGVTDLTKLNDKIAAVACNTYIGFSFIPDGEYDSLRVIFGNNTTNPSLLYYYNPLGMYYSSTGTESTSIYGASIVIME